MSGDVQAQREAALDALMSFLDDVDPARRLAAASAILIAHGPHDADESEPVDLDFDDGIEHVSKATAQDALAAHVYCAGARIVAFGDVDAGSVVASGSREAGWRDADVDRFQLDCDGFAEFHRRGTRHGADQFRGRNITLAILSPDTPGPVVDVICLCVAVTPGGRVLVVDR